MDKNNNDLFYTCSLIEYIGRQTKNPRNIVFDKLGKQTVKRIYDYADVFHSWIEQYISNYNTDFFYQSREYIALCYKEGEILEE